MRVHHIINNYALADGGAERLVRSLHLGLRKRGIESFILGLQKHSDDGLEYSTSLGLRSPYGLKALNGIRRYIRDYIKEGDLIHAHLFPTNLYLSILKQLGMISVPNVATEHSTSNRRREYWAGSVIDTVVYRGFDKIFAISEGVEQELLRWQPQLREKTVVVMNGSRLLFDQPLLRESSSPAIVLSVGILCKQKNYKMALSAFSLLKDYDVEYWIAGEGPDRKLLEQYASVLGIGSKVKFLGYVEDIKPVLEQADLFLMPSLREGFGLAAVEAMNASLPVIASDISGLREVVAAEPACAVLIDPLSPPTIADALRALLDSRERRISMGRNGFTRSTLFDEDKMFESYLHQYREVLKHA